MTKTRNGLDLRKISTLCARRLAITLRQLAAPKGLVQSHAMPHPTAGCGHTSGCGLSILFPGLSGSAHVPTLDPMATPSSVPVGVVIGVATAVLGALQACCYAMQAYCYEVGGRRILVMPST